jgi:hypothetical protein
MGRDFMIVAAGLWSNLAELKSRVDVLDRTLNRGVCEQRPHFEPAVEGAWC